MMKRLVALLAATGGLSLLAMTGACGDDETGGSGGNGSGAGGPSCEPTSAQCPAVGIESECLALTDNTGLDTFALRLSQLSVSAPTALTSDVVYNLIADGVNINLPTCNVSGMGTFSMIAQFDRTAGSLTLAGAFPTETPGDGYCFIDDAANEVAPVTVNSNLNDDGTFETDPIPRIVVPIYVDQAGSSIVYLPLREGRFLGGQVSADQNCVGKFNADGLKPESNCAPDPAAGIEYYDNGASLEGYITLEDADAVDVELIGTSLCVLLSGDTNMYGDGGTPIERCARDGMDEITLQGDWCSETNSAGGCMDAFRLQAELAASAVTVRSDCP